MRILDCKNERCHALSVGAPEITDCLCDECAEHFEKVKSYLTAAGVTYTCDPRLVRGLDYYTKTAFEIKYEPLGAQSAVAGGGRYDGLVEEIGGAPTPAVGFAVGLERVMLAMEMQGLFPETEDSVDAFIVAMGDEAKDAAFCLLAELRDAGLSARMDYAGRSMKSQMKQADKANARYALILGEDELAKGVVTVRNMESSGQEQVARNEIINMLSEVKE